MQFINPSCEKQNDKHVFSECFVSGFTSVVTYSYSERPVQCKSFCPVEGGQFLNFNSRKYPGTNPVRTDFLYATGKLKTAH